MTPVPGGDRPANDNVPGAPEDSSDGSGALSNWALRWYRMHRGLYAAGVVVLHAINIWQGAPWWAFWPTMVWGIPFCIHFFLYKSLTVDEQWADERIDDLRAKSYDIAHMTDLEDRILDDDSSTRPAHRRDPDWWRHAPHGARDPAGTDKSTIAKANGGKSDEGRPDEDRPDEDKSR